MHEDSPSPSERATATVSSRLASSTSTMSSTTSRGNLADGSLERLPRVVGGQHDDDLLALNHSLPIPVERLAGGLALLAAFVVGLFARLFQVPICRSRWTTSGMRSRRPLGSSYREIVLSFGLADHSIPVALYSGGSSAPDACRKRGCSLRRSRPGSHLRPAGGGVAQGAVADCLGPYAGLLAVSPLLVLYARQARPYAFTLLLCLVAAWAAYRWWRGGKWIHAAVYLVAAPLAVWMHLIVAPFVLGVWLVFLVEWLSSPRRDWQRLVSLLAIVGPGGDAHRRR